MLHVAVTAHGAQAGAGLAEVAAQQREVGDFLDGRYRMLMLGDAHRPADDHPFGIGIQARGLFDLAAGKPGLGFDLLPGRCLDEGQVGVESLRMLGNEGMVEQPRLLSGLRLAFPLPEVFDHAAHQRHVATEIGPEVGGAGRAVPVGEHLQRPLRMLETLQAALFQRIERHHAGAALDGLAQRFEHPWVVGTRVLAEHEDRVGMLEILEADGAFAHADALPQRHATGFVTQVRTIGEVVAAKRPDEQLIEVGRLVAGAPGGVEFGLVRVVQALEVTGDQGEGFVPADGVVAVAGAVVTHWLGQAPLIFEPVITLLAQLADAVTGEKGGVDAALGGFPVHRLGAVLAELDRPGLGGFAPGAAGTIETAMLIGLEQGADVLQRIVATEPVSGHASQRTPASGCAGIGSIAGGRLETIVTGHAVPRELKGGS